MAGGLPRAHTSRGEAAVRAAKRRVRARAGRVRGWVGSELLLRGFGAGHVHAVGLSERLAVEL